MVILGISAFYHDSAVAIVKDGDILYAAQEERFTRKKHDPRFPVQALKNAYQFTGLSPEDVDWVVFYEKPFLKFDRLLSTYVQFAPKGLRSFLSAMPVWFKEKLFIKQIIADHTLSSSRIYSNYVQVSVSPIDCTLTFCDVIGPQSEEDALKMQETGTWEDLRAKNGWQNLYLPGDQFVAFLKQQEDEIGGLMRELGFLK